MRWWRSAQQHQNHAVTSEKHLAHEAILIDTSATSFALLRPHLLHILQHHVAVSIKCFDPGEQLSIVAARDENLCVCSAGGLKDGEWAGREFMSFDERDFVFPKQPLMLAKNF